MTYGNGRIEVYGALEGLLSPEIPENPQKLAAGTVSTSPLIGRVVITGGGGGI